MNTPSKLRTLRSNGLTTQSFLMCRAAHLWRNRTAFATKECSRILLAYVRENSDTKQARTKKVYEPVPIKKIISTQISPLAPTCRIELHNESCQQCAIVHFYGWVMGRRTTIKSDIFCYHQRPSVCDILR